MNTLFKSLLTTRVIEQILKYLDKIQNTVNKETKTQTSRIWFLFGLVGFASIIPPIWRLIKICKTSLRNVAVIDFSKRYLPNLAWNPKKPMKKEYSSWVLITSPCTAVGKRFCESFSQKGFNIILSGVNKAKMGDLAGHLMNKYNNNVMIVDINFTKEYREEEIEKYLYGKIATHDISLVVINPAYLLKGPFEETKVQEIYEQTRFNIIAPTLLLKLLTPKLNARAKERATGVIFVTSPVGSKMQLPSLVPYSCACAYLQAFAKSYQQEYKDIDVMYFSDLLDQILYPEDVDLSASCDSDVVLKAVKSNLQSDIPFLSNFQDFFILNYWWLFRRYFRDVIKRSKKPDNDLLLY
jgi:Short-chain dehydrogenases of various substrate specificities